MLSRTILRTARTALDQRVGGLTPREAHLGVRGIEGEGARRAVAIAGGAGDHHPQSLGLEPSAADDF